MAKITYSSIRNEDNGDGSLYQLTATLTDDTFYDDTELSFGNVNAYLEVQDNPAQAIIYFYGEATDPFALTLPAEVFDSSVLPDGVDTTIDFQSAVPTDPTDPNVPVEPTLPSGEFVETEANDGAVAGDVVFQLDGDKFWDELAGEDLNGYAGVEVVHNVPAGMTAHLIVDDSLEFATLTLEGTAENHAEADSTEITVGFDADLRTYFESGTVPAAQTFAVSFTDTSSITIENTLKESALNDGTVEGSVVFTLNQAEFNADIDVNAIIDSVPEGLTPELAISEDGKTATLTFSGEAVENDVDANFNVGFTADDFVDGNAPVEGLNETGTELTIDFIAPKLVLSDEFAQDGLNFDQGWESTAGDNTISTLLTLEDATFIRSDLDLTKFVSGLPDGVSATLMTISDIEAELTFTVEDGVTFDPAEVEINLPKVVFTNRADVAERSTVIALTNDDMTAPEVPTISIEAGNNDTVITDEERTAGVTISGKGEPGSTITLTFGTDGVSEVVARPASAEIDPAELASAQDDLTLAKENLATAQTDLEAIVAQNKQDITDAQDETLNGVGDARGFLVTAQDDLTQAEKDTTLTATDLKDYQDAVTSAEADLATAESDAATTLADLQDDTLNGIADAQQAVADAEQEVANAQAAYDALVGGTDQPTDGGTDQPTDGGTDQPTDGGTDQPTDGGTGSPVDGTNAEIVDVINTATVTVDQNGDWTYTLQDADLINGYGKQLISAVATDKAGNASGAATVEITLEDTTPPALTTETMRTYDKVDGKLVESLSLKGTAEAGATVALTFTDGSTADANVDENGAWTYALTNENYLLAEQGNLNVNIVATDMAGNTSSEDYEITDVPDNVAPPAPVFAEITTLNSGDELTGTVDVSGEPSDVEVYLTFVDKDGNEVVTKKATVDAEGNWTYTVKTRDLLDDNGDRIATVTAVAKDMAGNTSDISGAFEVPLPLANVAITGIDANGDGNEYISNVEVNGDSDVIIKGTADPNSEIVLVFADDSQLEGITADENGNWEEFIPAAYLSDASLTSIVAKATVEGKQSADSEPFTNAQFDFVEPEVPAFVSEPVLNGNNLEFAVTVAQATDGDDAVAVKVSLDGGEFTDEGVTNDNGTWTYSALAPNQTDVSIVVASFDKAGNRADADAVSLELIQPANITISGIDAGADGWISTSEQNGNGDVVISGTADPNAIITLTLNDGSTIEGISADENGDWHESIAPIYLTEEALSSITATATVDGKRDNTSDAFTAAQFDFVAPAKPTLTVDPSVDAAGNLVFAATVAAATDGDETTLKVSFDSGENFTDMTKSETGDWTYLAPAATDKSVDVLVAAFDKAGNETDADVFTLQLDSTPPAAPTFTFGGKDNVATDTVVSTTKTVSVTLAADVARWEYTLDGANANAVYTVGTGTGFDLTPDVYGVGEIKVRAYDAAGNMSEASNAAQFESEVSVFEAGSYDAAGADVGFQVVAGEYTYNIANFGKGDQIDFPSVTTPTVKNSNFTDGIVDLQYAADGKVTLVHLTGLTAEQDGQLYSVAQFNKVFGDNTITNFGTGVAGTPTTPTTPTEPTTPSSKPAIEETKTVSAAGTTDVSAKATQLDFGSGNYNATVTGFSGDDVLNFPDDVKATVKNSNFTDGNVDVQWAANGQVVLVTLTGLTAAQDASLYSANAFNNVFGAGSLV